MNAPKTDWGNSCQGTAGEMISAMSALNMYPDPIEGAGEGYLSETDAMAKHAYEHMQAAMTYHMQTQRLLEGFCREAAYVLDVRHGVEHGLDATPKEILASLVKLRKQYQQERRAEGNLKP